MIKKNFIHIRNLKQALNQRSVLNKVNRAIKFNSYCLKSDIDINIKLIKKHKILFAERYFQIDE